MKIHFLISGDIHKITGGSIYNKRISEGLKERGHDIWIHRLDDDYPFPSEHSLKLCLNEISEIPGGEHVIIDSLVFGVIPDLLKNLHGTNPVIAIIHLLLAANKDYSASESNLLKRSESRAVKYAAKFVATSPYTEVQLLNLGIDRKKISVIIPGVDYYPQKRIYPVKPANLLCISNYTPGKGHIVLAKALGRLKYLNWELHCYGDLNMNPLYVDKLKTVIEQNGLNERMFIHPLLSRHELTDVFLGSDIFIHPSDFETYGIALTEALAHGIPVVASTGGEITKTVPEGMGIFFEPGDAGGLSAILLELFKTPLYAGLCGQASGYYRQAHPWSRSISSFEELLMM